jgi:hypothetical protein
LVLHNARIEATRPTTKPDRITSVADKDELERTKGGAVASNDQLGLSLNGLLHYLRNPYGLTEDQLKFYARIAADELEKMDNKLKTPVAWKYHIAAYCDHATASGVVLHMDEMKNIPERYISWEPVFIGA